jgi:anti-anti-sigma factor
VEIIRRSGPDGLELAVSGRLDAYWADHLTAALDEAIRGGAGRIALDLQGVAYLSSGGIRTLLVAHRELGRVGGSLRIVRPSDAVVSMLEMAGLLELLVLAPSEPVLTEAHGRTLALENGSLEVWTLEAEATLDCHVIGDPGHFASGFDAAQCRTATFPSGTFGLGLGAFGRDFEDCRGRFGELLAVAGAAVYLPTDGTNVPDFLIAGADAAPEVRLLYGVRFTGAPQIHARFEATSDRAFTLSSLAAAALELLAADRIGLIVIGEAAGLVGAALRRSPALAAEPPDLDFPEIRRWISFTPDRAFAASQALAVGIAGRGGGASNGAGAFLRPIGASGVSGHFHAAAFSHRPLPRGPLELDPTVAGLFETEAPRGLLHLLHDDRPVSGLGESELWRGALWAGPISTFAGGPTS